MKYLPIDFNLKYGALLIFFLASCTSKEEYQRSYTWSSVQVDSAIEESDHLEEIIAPYRVRLDSMMNEVIGYASHDLTAEGQYESDLGTFVTQVILNQSRSSYNKDVDLSIMNHHGGLRASINKGPVELGEVYEVMPFENEMLLLEVPGDSLVKLVEFVGQSHSSMIWPVSFEVTNSGVKNIKVNGEKINLDKNYTLAVSDYQANGGSGFSMLKPLKRIEVEPVKLRDMLVKEIRDLTAQGDTVKTEVAHLITVTNP
ncbi:5'-nucleotidase C-terminal domain-containing protein [Fulvivirga maritima]|uniref:5'-nucleotidase C-terminal domain-containing protein n=1 Tax=Fulvivirga maritima TaxID=2904247 RepID=UPI001F1A69E2|nr:5'-nucleotidase [Fulvivirga maritima]UII25825.1 5'-nucleotidase C-terminal domain-containing protein [Fulvivirga maritima]